MVVCAMLERTVRKDISITEARTRLTQLPEEMGANSYFALTRRGKPVIAMLPWELYEAIQDTLEIMSDPELMEALLQSIQEAKEGKLIPWEEVKAELGLEA